MTPTMNTSAEEFDQLKKTKWTRRDKKQRPKMAVHGRGLKRLAQKLDERRRVGVDKKRSA